LFARFCQSNITHLLGPLLAQSANWLKSPNGLLRAINGLSGFFTHFSVYQCKQTISVFVLFQILEYVLDVVFYAPSGSFER